MILVTGAAGKTGRAVTSALVQRGHSVRVLVHRTEQKEALGEHAALDIVVGDMRDAMTWSTSLAGVRAVYHICPNVSPDEMLITQLALESAQAAEIEHFVYHSVLHPQIESMPHHWLKLRTEEKVLESNLAFTILQPAAYMQNVLPQWDSIVRDGIYQVPYAIETVIGMVDLSDIAEAAAVVLTEAGHSGAIYELCGPDRLTQLDVAETLSRRLGRPVVAAELALDDWEREARMAGLGKYQISTLLQMFRYYAQHGFWGNSRVLGWVLGHAPTTFDEFVTSAVKVRNATRAGQ